MFSSFAFLVCYLAVDFLPFVASTQLHSLSFNPFPLTLTYPGLLHVHAIDDHRTT